jgi:Sap, sulfolipid-1-addressing protein
LHTLLELLLLAIAAAFYPALLAVVIIFLGRPRPKRLLTFFLAGAWLVSMTIGLVVVFGLDGAGIRSSTRGTINASIYISVGAFALVVGGYLLGRTPRPKTPKQDGKPSLTQRYLTKDSSWLVFVLGIVLNMPGVWYLIALKDIGLTGWTSAEKVLALVGFNLIMFAFVEAPLIGYLVAPDWSRRLVDRFNAWLHRHGRHLAGYIAVGIGIYLLVRGILAAQ